MTTTREKDSQEPTDSPSPTPTTTTATDALKHLRSRHTMLKGTLERNQGRVTFSGRMTLEQLVETTTVHNRAWADAADVQDAAAQVTQREIQSAHATALTYFLLQGVATATLARLEEDSLQVPALLRSVVSRLSPPSSVAIPPVTLVLSDMPEIVSERYTTSLALPAGTLFLVADGQHRREAARRLRDLFTEVIASGAVPKSAAPFLGGGIEPGALTEDLLDVFVSLQDTFRAWTFVAYEAHLGLNVAEMRQLFINYNYHAKPVSAELSLSFDESHPLNVFNKGLQESLRSARSGLDISLRQLATITGLAVMGRPNMRRMPRDPQEATDAAEQFWTLIRTAKDFKRPESLLRSIPVMKGLAKAYWVAFRAPGRFRAEAGSKRDLRATLKTTTFDKAWLMSLSGMRDLAKPQPDGSMKFSPAHNEIVAKIVASVLS